MAFMSTELSRVARKGDTLRVGRFLSAGSPVPEAEPFCAFFTALEPTRVSTIAHGDVFEIRAPHYRQYDGRRTRFDSGSFRVQFANQKLPSYMVFLDTGHEVQLGDLPMDIDFKWELVEESEIYPRH